jgi:hypothetical protein
LRLLNNLRKVTDNRTDLQMQNQNNDLYIIRHVLKPYVVDDWQIPDAWLCAVVRHAVLHDKCASLEAQVAELQAEAGSV